MKPLYRLPLLLLLCAVCSPVLAQQRVHTFVPEAPEATPFRINGKAEVIENIVKFDPLQLLYGEFGLHYERRINDQLGWEVGGGITFQDYIWNLGRNIGGSDFMDPQRIESHKNGIALRTALRLYPVGNGDEPNRFFMGLGVQFKSYSWTTVVENYQSPTQPGVLIARGSFDESRKLTDIQILFGQQHFINTNMMVEYFGGAVVRFQQLQGVNFDIWDDPASGIDTEYEDNSTGPNIVVGLRLAYGF